MDTQDLLIENNIVMHRILEEIASLRSQITKPTIEVDTCTPDEALKIIGLNNPRYLTYYTKLGLLTRRKGGSGFIYYISECREIANKIKNKELMVLSIKEIYGKGNI